MFDTIGVYIPISDAAFDDLSLRSLMTARIDQQAENMRPDFEYHNLRTHIASHNYGISWGLSKEHFVHDVATGRTVRTVGVPFLRLEFSAPKVLHGHNLESIDVDGLIAACNCVRSSFEEAYSIPLPSVLESWHVYRLDLCANYELSGLSECLAYIKYLSRFEYPRRETLVYESSVYSSSRSSTFKLYCKGPEFKAHDAKKIYSDTLRRSLQCVADRILRSEVELKARLKYLMEKAANVYAEKLAACGVKTAAFYKVEFMNGKKTFKGFWNLDNIINLIDWKTEMEMHMKRFLAGFKESKIMKSEDVLALLLQSFGKQRARNYHYIFLSLVTYGKERTREKCGKTQYYAAIKAFRSLGISCVVSDVELNGDFQSDYDFESGTFLDRGFPPDFCLSLDTANKYYQLPKAA